MLLKEKASHWLYLPVVIMLVMLLLTQSRGPIIALVLAVGCTLHLHVFTGEDVQVQRTADRQHQGDDRPAALGEQQHHQHDDHRQIEPVAGLFFQ